MYFADATHPAYDAHAACGWILRGETRELKANHGRVRINVNGALNAATCALIHRQEELITSAAMIALLRDLEAAHPAVPEIVVVLDNARYNRSKELREWLETSRIKLVYLPAYAPNLNLTERFWGFLKKNVIWNRYYPTFAECKDAIEKFLQNIGAYRDDLQPLLSHRFHLIRNSYSRYSCFRWVYWSQYLGDAHPCDPWAAPLHADLRGLPPVLLAAAGPDCLLDDSLCLAELLTEADVEADLSIYPALRHSFALMTAWVRAEDGAVTRAAARLSALPGASPPL